MSAPPLTAEVVSTAAEHAARWIAFRRERLQVPGVQVALRWHGELLHSSAHGFADVEKSVRLTPEHVFRVASHSKTFTATTILRLVEQGRLRLDDRLCEHLDWVSEADPKLGHATLRELLSHAAGVTRDGRDGDFWQLDGEFLDDDGLRRAVRSGGSLIPRSSRFKYSNIGYSLLGSVIEAVTGTTFAETVGTHLLEPLGLTSTTPDLPRSSELLVRGYSGLATGPRRPLEHARTAAMAAATGFSSNAEDLTAWFSAHATGRDDVLDAHSRRLAQRVEWAVEGDDRTYGLGFIGERCGERALVGHSGGFPGHITKSVLDPTAGLAVSVLTNCVDGPAAELALGLVRIVDLVARTFSGTGPVDLTAFTGRWANLWGVLDVVAAGGTLLGLDPDSADPAGTPVRFDVVDASTLRVSDDGGFGSFAEWWTRGERADGTPTLSGHSGMTMVPLDRYAPT